MIGSLYDYLRPAQLAALLGIKTRQTAHVLGALEALGFDLAPDTQGARLIHPELAQAVKAARDQGRELATLRQDPALHKFLPFAERSADLDLLDILIRTHAEVAIVRGVVGALSSGLRGIGDAKWQREGWRSLGLPDPRNDL